MLLNLITLSSFQKCKYVYIQSAKQFSVFGLEPTKPTVLLACVGSRLVSSRPKRCM